MGGQGNAASGNDSVVVGGELNRAVDTRCIVSGGANNTAGNPSTLTDDRDATVTGGCQQTVSTSCGVGP